MTARGCVLIHGFTGSPKEIEILANLMQFKNIEAASPILAGHNLNLRRCEMKKASYQDWIASAEIEVKKMVNRCEEVYIIGFSMGGIIAAHLATKYPIKKLVLLSASVYCMTVKNLLFNNKLDFLRKDQLKRYLYKIIRTPLCSVINFRKLVQELLPCLDFVEIPTLIIHGAKDDIVEPMSSMYIYNTIKSKDKSLFILPNSRHIVCWDSEKEQVVKLVNQFI